MTVSYHIHPSPLSTSLYIKEQTDWLSQNQGQKSWVMFNDHGYISDYLHHMAENKHEWAKHRIRMALDICGTLYLHQL